MATETPKQPTSRDIDGPDTHHDEARDQQEASIKDADKTDQAERDNVHGDGKGLGLDRP